MRHSQTIVKKESAQIPPTGGARSAETAGHALTGGTATIQVVLRMVQVAQLMSPHIAVTIAFIGGG